jgi:hypothetical protein
MSGASKHMQEMDTSFSRLHTLLLDSCTLFRLPIERPSSFYSALGHPNQQAPLNEHLRPKEHDMQEDE